MIEIIQNMNSFLALEKQWNRLAASFHTPLLQHQWFLSCLRAFYREEEMFILTLRQQGELTAVAPLIRVRNKGIQRLKFIGVTQLLEPCGLLYSEIGALHQLLHGLCGCKKIFKLSRINREQPVLQPLQQLTKGKGLLVNRSTVSSPRLICNSSWDDYYSSLSARRRYDHRRAAKRAKKAGSLEFVVSSPKMQEFHSLLEQAFAIEAASWKKRFGAPILTNHHLRTFFLDYTGQVAKDGRLRLFFLYIDGRPVAMQICEEYANRLWVLKIGYNENWARCSPGVLLMKYAIRYAFEQKLDSFEFLGFSEPWLDVWANEKNAFQTIIFYPYSLPGLLGLSKDRLYIGLRRLKNRLPAINN